MILEDTHFYPGDGVPQKDPDSYWHYRFDLMLDAASTMQGFLELLVDYRQKRKLTQFLLNCCDLLEITFDRHTDSLQEYRFRIDFSDRISLQYSSRLCDCIVFWDGKKDHLPTLTPESSDALSRALAQIWEDIRMLPIWETFAETPHTLCVTRSYR